MSTKQIPTQKSAGEQSIPNEPNGSSSPYTEIYHNDNNFLVQFQLDRVEACEACGVDFNHRQEHIPYNLVFSHRAKWTTST